MTEYNIELFQGNSLSKIDIIAPSDIEYHLTIVNKDLSEGQVKQIVKSLVEITEGVFLAERGAEFE